MIDRVPEPLQTLMRRLTLRLRIPLNKLLAAYRYWSRKWYRFLVSDSTSWHQVDIQGKTRSEVRCFCISLLDQARFEARRQFFQRNAKKYGWEVEFWPAVNGEIFKAEGYPNWLSSSHKVDNNEPFGAGAVGLLKTTKDIYEWAWEQELDMVVIFEDDAVIHSSPTVEIPKDFDLVFFNNRVQGDKTGLVKHGWGTDGYIISRRGIRKMLEIFDQVTADIDMLIMMYAKSLENYDYYVTRYRDRSKPQLDCYHIGPLVTHAGFFPSSVGLISN